MRSSLQLGQLAGIKIGIHYMWLLAFVLIAWSLATGYFPSIVPSPGAVTYWTLGVIAALLLFVSVLQELRRIDELDMCAGHHLTPRSPRN